MNLGEIISWLFIPFGMLCLYKPILILYLFVALSIFPYAPTITSPSELKIIKIGSINFYTADYLILIFTGIIVSFLIKNLIKKEFILTKLFESPISKAVVALFIWNIFIGFLSYSKGYTVQNVLRELAGQWLMFLAIFIPLIEKIDIKKERFFNFCIILGVLLVLFALTKYFLTHETEFTSSYTMRTLRSNAVVILMFPICYLLFYSRFWEEHKILSRCVWFFLAVGIPFTGHRSGILVLLMASAFYLFRNNLNTQKIWVPLFGISFIFLIMLIATIYKMAPGQSILSDSLLRTEDTFNLENATTQERLSKWRYSIETAEKNPFLGLGRFPVYTQHIGKDNRNLKSFKELNRSVHNIFFDKLIHEGIIGLIIIITFFYFVLKQCKRVAANNRKYSIFLCTYILLFIFYCLFNTSFRDYEMIYFFILLGFLNVEVLKTSKPYSRPDLV